MVRALLLALLFAAPALAAEIPPAAESYANAYYRVKTISTDASSAAVESIFNGMAASRCRYVDKLGEDRIGVRVVFLCQR